VKSKALKRIFGTTSKVKNLMLYFFVPLHGVKAHWGVEKQLHTSLISELGEIEWTPLSWYTLNRRLDEFQGRCGHFGK
jgi:hypothetical protein